MASPDSDIPKDEAGGLKALINYLNRVWRAFLHRLPSPDPRFLAKISTIYPGNPTAGSRKRRSGLPFMFQSNAIHFSPIATEASRIFLILEDMMEHVLLNLHKINESLTFWQAREAETDYQKMWFMVFNRGPWAFFHQSFQIIRKRGKDGHPFQSLTFAAADTISVKITVLTSLQRYLAVFLTEVFVEVNKFDELLIEDAKKSLPSLLVVIDNLLSKLEESINHPRKIYNANNGSLSTKRNNSCLLVFDKLSNMEHAQTQWSKDEIRVATCLTHQNLQRLDSYLSFMLSICQKPSKMQLYWFHYTCGAVGLSACSFWILRHSSLMGSSDIDNWTRAAKESTISFWEEHVEQPLISIRDELFETFRKRHKGVMELEEVQLTSNSLHRMLIAFSEQTKGQKIPENLTDQEMMEIVMSRYEKEVMHPLQNLVSGELARAMLIQIQKLKLDLETAMLELDQILKANEINFAVLAALPAFFISLILLYLAKTWVLQDKGEVGRGRTARIRRRLLLVEVEEWIMQFQACMEQGMEEDARCMFGLMLYNLDELCKAVEKNAKETHEWPRLRQDIMKLAKPEVKVEHKIAIVSRMGRMYDCLLPYSKQR